MSLDSLQNKTIFEIILAQILKPKSFTYNILSLTIIELFVIYNVIVLYIVKNSKNVSLTLTNFLIVTCSVACQTAVFRVASATLCTNSNCSTVAVSE